MARCSSAGAPAAGLAPVSATHGMDQVLPGLYVGSYRDSKDLHQLSANSITHIVAVHDTAKKWYKDKSYLLISAADTPQQNLVSYIPRCNDFIHSARQAGGSVLIHCLAGMSRSVAVALAYVISVTSVDCETALQAMRAARPIANPNEGFLKQLNVFEAERLQQERQRLREKYSSYDPQSDAQHLEHLSLLFRVSLLAGQTCEGRCLLGHHCPRGVCNHSKRTVGIFRQRWSGSHSSLPSSPNASSLRSAGLSRGHLSASTRSLAARPEAPKRYEHRVAPGAAAAAVSPKRTPPRAAPPTPPARRPPHDAT